MTLRFVAAVLAGGAMSAGLAFGAGVAVADDSMNPAPPTVAQAAPEAIVPNGVTGEAAKAAQAAQSAAAAGDPAAAGAQQSAPTTPDQLLMMLSQEYDTGAGGGKVSQLVHAVMKLRAQGFKPSKANIEAITSALDHRPNQGPLVEALTATLATQRKQQAQNDTLQGNNTGSPFVIGVNQPNDDHSPFGDWFIVPGQ